jgi:hypothetical protein
MSEITVASTTDAQNAIDQAAGLQVKEAEVQPKEGEEPEQLEAEQAEKKPKSAFQKRIDKLVRERGEATKEVEELKARLLKLEQGTNGHKAEEPPKKEEQSAVPQTPPKPEQKDFQTYEEWIEALSDWKVDRKLEAQRAATKAEQDKQAAETAQKQALSAYEERLNEARERYEDFDDVAFRKIDLYEGVAAIIRDHPNGADLQYYLGRNPKVAKELMEVPVHVAMARAGAIAEQLGRTEEQEPTSERIEKEAAEEKPNAFTPRRAQSAAPAPIRPVGGSATKSSVPIDELPYGEFRKLRDQQEKARYRR